MRVFVAVVRAAGVFTLAGAAAFAPAARAQTPGGTAAAADSLVPVMGYVRGPDGIVVALAEHLRGGE